MKKPKAKVKPVKAWAGVVDGRILNWSHIVDQPINMPSYDIFASRKLAKLNYDEVIRVEICEVKPKRVSSFSHKKGPANSKAFQ